MNIDKQIIQQRKIEFHNLYQELQSTSDKEKEKIFSTLKKTYKSKPIIDLLYTFLTNDLSIILNHLSNIFQSYDNNTIIKLDDLLYNKDNKTLEERIEYWFDIYPDPEKNIYNLFNKLCLILDTEKQNLVPASMKQKIKDRKYAMVYMTGGDCTNGICEDYADEELHPIDEIEEPPYHPNCMCEVCEFELQDLINKE